MPRNPNVMGYLFPPNTRVVSSFSFCQFFFFFLSLTFLSLNCSPLSKSIRSWYGWLGILSWRWPIIQGACTILEEQPTRAMVIVMVIRRIQRRLLAISRKMWHHWLPVVKTYSHTIHSFFFFAFMVFFFLISLCKHLDLFWDKRLYLRTSFYIYAFN